MLTIRSREIDGDFVCPCPLPRFSDVAGRKIAGGDAGPAPCKHDRSHAVTATQVEHLSPGKLTESGHRRTNPRLVIEILRVSEAQPMRLGRKGRGAGAGLLIVESTF